jgi:ABC-type branched-subunit amino acid transport system ATPase component
MKTTKALETNMNLTTTLTNACLDALKAGMAKEEIAALLTRLAEIIDNSDD